MNLPLLLCFAIILGCSLAQKPCCIPDAVTWTSVSLISFVGSKQLVSYTVVQNVAIDSSHGMVGVEEIIYNEDGTATAVKVIEDFNKKVIYTITGLTCSKTDFPDDYVLQQCIPDGATLIGVDKAPLSGISIDVQTWAGYQDIDGIRGNYTLSVLPDDCRPVSELLMGENSTVDPPMSQVMSLIYSDFAYGVSQPERYFTIPIYCNNQASDVSYIPRKLLGGRPGIFLNKLNSV